MHRKKSPQAFYAIVFLFLSAVFLILTCYKRIVHTYLEDDFLWCLPLIDKINHTQGFWQRIVSFQSGEMSLFDGMYFSAMLVFFGNNLKLYTVLTLAVFLASGGLLFFLLFRRMKVPLLTSVSASIIYLTFYGHFHAYIRPVSASHLWVVFFILLLFNLYLKVNELKDKGEAYGGIYAITLLAALFASVMRLSILIFPAAVILHVLLTARRNEDVVKKLALWAPILFVVSAYQLVVVTVIGKEGHTLRALIEPWHQVLGQHSILGILMAYVFLWTGFLGAFFLLGKIKVLIPLQKIVERFLYLGIGAVHFLVLCFWVWIKAPPSAWNYDPLMRWQMMFYPAGASFGILLIGSAVIFISFVRYSLLYNRNLCLLIGWFFALTVFLGWELEPVPSRYLIYISPVFAAALCVFLFEILPRRRFFNNDYWRAAMLVLISVLGLMNIYSIGVRLNRTLIGDYIWSYDYIKAANVISADLNRKGKLSGKGLSVCVKGVQTIPYLQDWKGFLGYGFEPMGPFIKTLASVLPRTVEIHINDSCTNKDEIYHLTDKTVVDGEGKSIEPFYRYLDNGLAALASKDLTTAREQLKRAAASPPFAIQFLIGSHQIDPPHLSYAAPILWASYAKYYQDDKLKSIGDMIQKESLDYGFVLALRSFLEKENGAPIDAVQKRTVVDFITAAELKTYSLASYFSENQRVEFNQFLNDLPPSPCEVFVKKMEEYKDYDIYWWQGLYFALNRSEGPFELAKFQRGHYHDVHFATAKHELRKMLDGASSKTEVPESDEETYRGFKIVREGAHYVSSISGAEATKFSAQTEVEAKIVIDSFLNPRTLTPPTYAEKIQSPEHFLNRKISYRVSLFNIPIGDAVFEVDRQDKTQSSLRLGPWPVLEKLSGGTLVLNMAAVSDNTHNLPEQFEKTTAYRMKKGKSPQKIIYHHDQLFMERKEYKEDILEDTRDPLSLLLWLSAQDYKNKTLVKSTLNIDRRIYVVTGKVEKNPDRLVRLVLEVTGIDNNYDKMSHYPVEIHFLKNADGYWPVYMKVKIGIWSLELRYVPKS